MESEAAKKVSDSNNLVSRIGAGDLAAEEELVAQYWKGLYFILKRRCADPQLAADLAQDTFIIVITKARKGEINKPNAVAGFIRQTGVNLMIAHFRKEKRRATEAHGEVIFEIPDQKTNIARAVESNQTLELVSQLMGELKVSRDQDILHSFYIKEEDKISICKRLDLTAEHFDRVLFRARARLKQLIDFKFGNENALR